MQVCECVLVKLSPTLFSHSPKSEKTLKMVVEMKNSSKPSASKKVSQAKPPTQLDMLCFCLLPSGEEVRQILGKSLRKTWKKWCISIVWFFTVCIHVVKRCSCKYIHANNENVFHRRKTWWRPHEKNLNPKLKISVVKTTRFRHIILSRVHVRVCWLHWVSTSLGGSQQLVYSYTTDHFRGRHCKSAGHTHTHKCRKTYWSWSVSSSCAQWRCSTTRRDREIKGRQTDTWKTGKKKKTGTKKSRLKENDKWRTRVKDVSPSSWWINETMRKGGLGLSLYWNYNPRVISEVQSNFSEELVILLTGAQRHHPTAVVSKMCEHKKTTTTDRVKMPFSFLLHSLKRWGFTTWSIGCVMCPFCNNNHVCFLKREQTRGCLCPKGNGLQALGIKASICSPVLPLWTAHVKGGSVSASLTPAACFCLGVCSHFPWSVASLYLFMITAHSMCTEPFAVLLEELNHDHSVRL